MFRLFRRYSFAAVAVFGFGISQPASAAQILLFGDGFGTNVSIFLTNTLTGLGHTVVNRGGAALTDADFVGIDTAWHVGSSNASYFGGTMVSALHNFLNSGGGLHLTGENPAFAAPLNTALLVNIVNPFTTGPLVFLGGTDPGPVTIANSLHAGIADALTSPNFIAGTIIGAISTGQLLGLGAGNTLAVGSHGEAVGAIFGANDPTVPDARLSIMLDVNWLGGGDGDVVENLQLFLQGGPEVVAMPEPGTAILLVTAGIFMVASRRRKQL